MEVNQRFGLKQYKKTSKITTIVKLIEQSIYFTNVLWHINHCKLFNAKSILYTYIKNMIFNPPPKNVCSGYDINCIWW